MSIYTLNELCKNCIHAKFIDGGETGSGENIFLKCNINVESFVDYYRGKCDDKDIPKNPKFVYSEMKLRIVEVIDGVE